MNTLIVGMQRTRSSLLYHGLAKTGDYTHCFYEPFFNASWFDIPMREAAQRSATAYAGVAQHLLDSESSTLVKTIPWGCFNPLSNRDAGLWREHFDEIFVLTRPFREIALSFLMAEKTESWAVRAGGETRSDVLTYDPATDRVALARVLYNWHTFDQWCRLFEGHPGLTKLSYADVPGYMDNSGIPKVLENQQSIPYQTRLTNLEEFEAEIERLQPYSEVWL